MEKAASDICVMAIHRPDIRANNRKAPHDKSMAARPMAQALGYILEAPSDVLDTPINFSLATPSIPRRSTATAPSSYCSLD